MRLPLTYVPFVAALAVGLVLGRPLLPAPSGPSPSFDPARALEATRAIVGEGEPRIPGGSSHERAREIIQDRLSTLGSIEITREGFTLGGVPYVNVLGTLPGKEGGRIYLGAHYDSRATTPGAVDNASGVGILLEAARALSIGGWRQTLVFVFWDGEESGLIGSRYHVQQMSPEERDATLAAISLDMPGWKAGTPVIHTFRKAWAVDASRLVPGWLPHLLLSAARESGEPLHVGDPWIPVHYQVGVRNMRVPFASDDGPFVEAGIPAVFMANSSFTAFFPHYHKPADGMDQVGEEALRACGKTLVAAAASLASLPARPEPGREGYLLVRGFLLPQGILRLLVALSLAPVLSLLARTRSVRDRVACAWLLLLGSAVFLFSGDPLLPVASIPLLLALPLLRRRSPWAVRGIALLGLLPALSTLFFMGLVKVSYGAHAPLFLSYLDWAAITAAPGLFLVHAVGIERVVMRERRGTREPGPPEMASQ